MKDDKKKYKIIVSGAFPDGMEVVPRAAFEEAFRIIIQELLRMGHTIVFGAHPTFQDMIFSIGRLEYCSKEQIEMYISEQYIPEYPKEKIEEIQKVATLITTMQGTSPKENLTIMRKEMIEKSDSNAMICIGGKVKSDKSAQGVDEEIVLASGKNIPVFLIGSVGGRASEKAYELQRSGMWSEINQAGNDLNKELFYSPEYRMLVHKIADYLDCTIENK